jgi:hypothetical protein
MLARRLIAVIVVVVAFAALTWNPAGAGVPAPKRAAGGPPLAVEPPSPTMFAFSARQRGGGPAQIFVVREDGGLTRLTHSQIDLEVAGWSADGSTLLARADDGGRAILEGVDLETGTARELWRGGGRIGDIVPSPVGGAVAFSVGKRLLMIPAADTRARVVTTRYAASAEQSIAAPSAAWAADGRGLSFSMQAGRGAVIAVTQAGGRPPVLVMPLSPACASAEASSACPSDTQPAWRTGTGQIAFVRSRHGRSSLRWVWGRGGKPRAFRLPGVAGLNPTSPVWSPDGRRLAFVSDGGLYAMNANGTALERVSATAPFSRPSWSPDGSRIAYVVRSFSGSNTVVTVRSLDGARPYHPSLAPFFGNVVGGIVWRPQYLSTAA